MWFEDPSTEDSLLSVGSGALGWASATAPGEEFLAWTSDSSGTVEIMAVDEGTASGYFEGQIELTVADRFESPTGELIRIEGFAFNRVPMVIPN